jgi:hypothetical protein
MTSGRSVGASLARTTSAVARARASGLTTRRLLAATAATRAADGSAPATIPRSPSDANHARSPSRSSHVAGTPSVTKWRTRWTSSDAGCALTDRR